MSASSHIAAYQSILTLQSSLGASFFGRVVAFKEARKSGGPDYVISMVVVDESMAENADITSDQPAGLHVSIFRPSMSDLPPVRAVGDIVSFRRFKIQVHNGCLQALSTKYSGWTVFRRNGPTSWELSPPGAESSVTEEQWERIKAIEALPIGKKSQRGGSSFPGAVPAFNAPALLLPTTTIGRSLKRPLLTMAEVRPSVYFDCVLRVLSVTKNDPSKCLLYGTDFTTNSLLSENNPYGPDYLKSAVIGVTLWDNYAEAAQERLKAGDHVLLCNLLAKKVYATSGQMCIEASLHGDPSDGQSTKVRRLPESDPLVNQICNQHDSLMRLYSVDADEVVMAVERLKKKESSPKRDVKESSPHQSSPLKSSPHRIRVIEREPESNAKEITTSPIKPSTPLKKHAFPLSPIKLIPSTIAPAYSTQISHAGIEISTILSVRSFPSDHAKFCVRAQALAIGSVDDVWSIVRVGCDHCAAYTELGLYVNAAVCGGCGHADGLNKWCFVFTLILDDKTADLPVIVAAEDAEHFLGFGAAEFASSTIEHCTSLLQRVLDQLERLTDNEESMLFCLQSYRPALQDPQSNALPGMRYRLLDTRMIPK